MSPRKGARLFLLLVVCLVLFDGIEGPESPGRRNGTRSRSRSRSRSPRSRGVGASFLRGVSNMISRRNSGGASSSQGGQRRSNRRSRSRSPGATPARQLSKEAAQINILTPNDARIVNNFARWQKNEVAEMTPTELRAAKDSLIRRVNRDYCGVNFEDGGLNCAHAVKKFLTIPQHLRGPCGGVFAGICHKWLRFYPGQIKCSFFIKTSADLTHPLRGYVYPLQECVDAILPEEYARQIEEEVDEFLNFQND